MQTDGIEVASVGNTVVLHESCLVEAFNLKSAIQFNLKNSEFSKKRLFLKTNKKKLNYFK